MAILAFQKPEKVIMLESTSSFGRFEFRPLEPGFKRFTVAPAPVDLTWFKTAVPTPHGEIGLVFRDGTYTLSVPENTTAVFRLNGKENEFGSGVHTIK